MKKGFTIVELLAVIAILAIIMLIAIPTSMGISKNIKKNMYCEKKDLIVVAAKNWGNDNLSSLKTNCYIEKSVIDLVNAGYLKKEESNNIMNPYNNLPMNNLKVNIYLKYQRAAAWYVETDTNLKTICEDKVPTDRPTRKC